MECECEHPKTQLVRLLDVSVVGPIMILGAWLLPKRYRPLALSLGVLGTLTVGYNARNYLSIRQRGFK